MNFSTIQGQGSNLSISALGCKEMAGSCNNLKQGMSAYQVDVLLTVVIYECGSKEDIQARSAALDAPEEWQRCLSNTIQD